MAKIEILCLIIESE